MKNYHLLLLLLVCLASSCGHDMTSDECQSKYTLVPGPCPTCPPCDLGTITTQPPDNTPQFFFKRTEAEALTFKTNYNPATGLLTGLAVSKNTLNYLLCTMEADTVFFDFAKDPAGQYTYVITYKKPSGELGWISHDPAQTGGQSICPPHCSKP